MIPLPALTGSNPLSFLAALGALAALDRQAPGLGARLWWSEGIVPRACIDGPSGVDDLIDLLERDRRQWEDSMILASVPGGEPVDEVKPAKAGIRAWAERVRVRTAPDRRRDADQFQALLAEFALAGNGNAKPTMLHFTAGRQRFLAMVRQLQSQVDPDALREAIVGPWRYESSLPVMGWDARGERIYALRGTNPSKDKKRGVPGADWLAFVGLSFLPSAKNGGSGRDQTLTTGCRGTWKSGSFHWPLWSVPTSGAVVRSLVAYEGLLDESEPQRLARGVFRMMEAPIRRDAHSLGSFGPAGEIGLGGRSAPPGARRVIP